MAQSQTERTVASSKISVRPVETKHSGLDLDNPNHQHMFARLVLAVSWAGLV